MKIRELGQSGIEASVVGLGTWAIGGWMWGGNDDDNAIRGIHAAIDHGITLIDTAPIYGFGHSEKIVGKAIADRRDKVILATKCGLVWNLQKGDFYFKSDEQAVRSDAEKYEVYKYLGPESIRHEVEESLRRLNVDVIDLYQTHWQESTTPIEETMNELLKLKDQGKIRAIGVSNASAEQIAQYQKAGPVDSDQERYSMLDRDIEQDQVPHCHEHDIAILAYSPLAQGLLTGKMTPNRSFNEGDLRKGNPRFSKENRETAQQMLGEFRPIADQYDLSLAQLTIAWTYHQTGITHVLCGVRDEKQAIENAQAGRVHISDEDLRKLDEILDKYKQRIK